MANQELSEALQLGSCYPLNLFLPIGLYKSFLVMKILSVLKSLVSNYAMDSVSLANLFDRCMDIFEAIGHSKKVKC